LASSVWRFTDDKGVEREISTVDLRAALMKGTLLPSTLVWREGMKEWVPAFTLPDLASAAIAAARVDRQKAGPPSVPPGTPIQRKKPTQTLQGIDPISLGNEAAAALMRIRGGQDAPPAPSPPAEPFNRASAPDSDDTLQEAVNKIVAPAPDPLAPRVVKTQPTGSLGTAIAATDIIPRAIHDKPPSAELAPDQKDTDSLPPYEVLDEILKLRIEGRYLREDEFEAASRFVADLDRRDGGALHARVRGLIARSEFKRKQAAPIIRLRGRAFGTGRQVPLAAHPS
jgi:hypothetical protein